MVIRLLCLSRWIQCTLRDLDVILMQVADDIDRKRGRPDG